MTTKEIKFLARLGEFLKTEGVYLCFHDYRNSSELSFSGDDINLYLNEEFFKYLNKGEK